jgi:hypothetical protein
MTREVIVGGGVGEMVIETGEACTVIPFRVAFKKSFTSPGASPEKNVTVGSNDELSSPMDELVRVQL